MKTNSNRFSCIFAASYFHAMQLTAQLYTYENSKSSSCTKQELSRFIFLVFALIKLFDYCEIEIYCSISPVHSSNFSMESQVGSHTKKKSSSFTTLLCDLFIDPLALLCLSYHRSNFVSDLV